MIESKIASVVNVLFWIFPFVREMSRKPARKKKAKKW